MRITLSGMLAVMALVLLGFSGCVKEDAIDKLLPEKNEMATPREFIVPIKMGGEILEISEGPLTKGTGNDLYGISVDCKEKGGIAFQNYAYGLFDDISDLKIKLIEGYDYSFYATMVVNGKNIIHHTRYDESEAVTYNDPFSAQLKNTFIYSTNFVMTFLHGGRSVYYDSMGKMWFADIPSYDRYYGVNHFSNISADANLVLDMKRTVFGFRFEVKGLKTGELSVNLQQNHSSTYTNPIFKIKAGEKQYIDEIFCPALLPEFIRTDKEELLLVVKNDKEEIIVNKLITFQRLKKTTVILDLEKQQANPTKGVEIRLENAPITDGEKIEL